MAEIIGILGLVCMLVSYQMKEEKKLLILQLVFCSLMAAHYSLLGGWMSTATYAVAALRNFLFMKSSSNAKAALVIGLLFASMLVRYEGIWSLLLFADGALYSLCIWYRNTQQLRMWAVIGGIIWILYDLHIGSYVGIVQCTLEMGSALIGYIRFKKGVRTNEKETDVDDADGIDSGGLPEASGNN